MVEPESTIIDENFMNLPWKFIFSTFLAVLYGWSALFFPLSFEFGNHIYSLQHIQVT